MASLGDLVSKLKVDDNEWRSGLTSGERALNRFGTNVKQIGVSMSTYITAPIAALGVVALAAARDYQASMNQVQAVTGATGTSFSNLSGLARELGASTKFSASEAADAMGFLGMAGFSANEILSATPGMLSLAAAGSLELAAAADIASNVLSGFSLEVTESNRVADVLAQTAASSNTSVSQLGEALSKVAPTAETAGLSLEATAASIGILGDAGVQGSIAGTNLKGTIAALVAPSTEAETIIKSLGISLEDLGKQTPLEQLQTLDSAGISLEETFRIFGREAATAATILMNSGPQIGVFTTELENSDGAAKKMADTMQKGLPGAITSLKSAWEGLMISISEGGLGTAATSFLGFATEVIRGAAGINPAILGIGTVIAGMVAAIGPLLVAVGLMSTAFTSGLAAVTAMGAGLVLLPARFAALTLSIAGSGGLVAALALIGPAVAVAAGAFVGWKLAEWLNENSAAWRTFADAAIQAGKDIGILDTDLNRLHDTNADLVAKTAELETELAAVGITVDRGSSSVATYYSELIKAGAESGLFATSTSGVEQSISQYAVGLTTASSRTKTFGTDLVESADDISFWKDQLDQAIEEGKRFSEAETAIKNALAGISGALPQVARDFDIIPQTVNTFTPQIIGKFASVAVAAEDMGARASAVILIGDKMQREDALLVAYKVRLDEINAGFVALGSTSIPQAGQSFDTFSGKATASQAPLIQVSTIITDLSRGLVDVVFEGGKFKDVLAEIGTAILRTIAEDVLGALISGIGSLIAKTLGVTALKTAFESLSGAIGFGAQGASGAASSLGGTLTGALSSLSSVIGMVGSAVGIISDIISIAQGARQEGTLNIIELNTRQTFGTLRDDIKVTLWHISERMDQVLPSIQAIESTIFGVFQNGETTNNILGDMKSHLASLAAGVIIAGGTVGVGVAGGSPLPTQVTNTPSVEVINLSEVSTPPSGTSQIPDRSRTPQSPGTTLDGLAVIPPLEVAGGQSPLSTGSPTMGNPVETTGLEGTLTPEEQTIIGQRPTLGNPLDTTPVIPNTSRQSSGQPTGNEPPYVPPGRSRQSPGQPSGTEPPYVPPGRSRQSSGQPSGIAPPATQEDLERNAQLERIARLMETNPLAVLGSGSSPLAQLATGGLQITVPEGEELDVSDPAVLLALDRSQQTQQQIQQAIENGASIEEVSLITDAASLLEEIDQTVVLKEQTAILDLISVDIKRLAERPIILNVYLDGAEIAQQVGLNIDLIEQANR